MHNFLYYAIIDLDFILTPYKRGSRLSFFLYVRENMDNNNDFQPYERENDSNRFTYFSNFRDSLPPYIWNQLIGIMPQQRRAFLLQQLYLAPLAFTYSLLQFFSQFAVNLVILHLVKLFWQYKGEEDPITFIFVFVSLIAAFILFRVMIAKNTYTIREEVLYRSVVDGFSLAFSLFVVFDVNQYWQGLF